MVVVKWECSCWGPMPGHLCVCVFAYISICGYLTAEGCVLSIKVNGEKFYAGFGVWAVPLSPFWNAFPTHSILTLDAFRLYHLHNGSYTDCIPALLHIRKASSGHGLCLFRALTIHTDKITWRNFLHYSFKHLSQNIKQKRFLHPSKMWGLILKFSQSFFKFLISFFYVFLGEGEIHAVIYWNIWKHTWK